MVIIRLPKDRMPSSLINFCELLQYQRKAWHKCLLIWRGNKFLSVFSISVLNISTPLFFFLPHFPVIVQENLTQEPNKYFKHIFLQCLPPHSPITDVILRPPNKKNEKEVRSLGHRA